MVKFFFFRKKKFNKFFKYKKAYAGKCGVDDMVMLTKISNDGINENLKKRHASDIIYVIKIYYTKIN